MIPEKLPSTGYFGGTLKTDRVFVRRDRLDYAKRILADGVVESQGRPEEPFLLESARAMVLFSRADDSGIFPVYEWPSPLGCVCVAIPGITVRSDDRDSLAAQTVQGYVDRGNLSKRVDLSLDETGSVTVKIRSRSVSEMFGVLHDLTSMEPKWCDTPLEIGPLLWYPGGSDRFFREGWFE